MNHITHLPLSFKLSPRSQPRTRYSAAAVAAMKAHRRACLWLAGLLILSPLAIAGLCAWLLP